MASQLSPFNYKTVFVILKKKRIYVATPQNLKKQNAAIVLSISHLVPVVPLHLGERLLGDGVDVRVQVAHVLRGGAILI